MAVRNLKEQEKQKQGRSGLPQPKLPSPRQTPPAAKKTPAKQASAKALPGGTAVRQVAPKRKLFSIRAGVDLPFLIVVLVLVMIGLVMMFSASYYYAYQNQGGDSFYYIIRQGIFAILGVALLFGISFVDYHVLHKLTFPFLIGTWLLLLITLFMPAVNGVHRWINLGLFSFQPSEFAKFAMILWFAHYISKYYDKMQYIKYGIVPNIVVIGITAGLVFVEPHYSATIIILLLSGIMLFVGGVQKRWFAVVLMLLGVVALCLLLFTNSYAGDRVQGWLNPFNDSSPDLWWDTWQTRNSLYAIGSGGLFGLGLGQSRQKYLWLPEPQNDFIFSIVCEELGLIGALIIVGLFGLLVYRGIKISLKARDKFGMLLGTGLSLQVGLQVVLNMGVVTNLLPNTGISLPFFSYGGTSLVVLLMQMGVVLSISRTAAVEKV